MGIPTVIYLDHWVNFQQRILYNNINVPPCELWVVDETAKEIAEYETAWPRIKIVPNYHLNYFCNEYQKLKSRHCQNDERILFISDNINAPKKAGLGNSLKNTYGDHDNFLKLIRNIEKMNLPADITVRLHPSEMFNKEHWLNDVKTNSYQRFSISQKSRLIDDFLSHSHVVGSDGMPLVFSASCGIPTYSCLSKAERNIPIDSILDIGKATNGL